MNTKSALPPYRQVTEHIRKQILDGEFQPGESLPSYRELMETFGLTMVTVRKAVMSLQFEGLIDTVPGRGSIVAPRKASPWHTLGLVEIGWWTDNPKLSDILASLQDQLDDLRCDIALRCISEIPETDEPTRSRALEGLVSWAKRLDGVILTGGFTVRTAQAVADAGVPVIVYGEPLDGPCPPGLPGVTIDVSGTVQLALSHLVSMGHRRIALCNSKGTRHYEQVTREFFAGAEQYGLGREVGEWCFDTDHPDRWPQLVDWLESRPHPPTALLVENSHRAAALMEALDARGWAIPARISVIAITAWERPWVMEGLSCIRTSARSAFLKAAQMLPEMIASESRLVRTEIILPTYVPGKTCQRPLE